MNARLATFEIAASPRAAVDRLKILYNEATRRLKGALSDYLEKGIVPSAEDRATFVYPELRVTYQPDGPTPRIARAFGKFSEAGIYAATITHPEAFENYLIDQLEMIAAGYPITIETGLSAQEIPYSYVLEDSVGLPLDEVDPAWLSQVFAAPRLTSIGDEVADGERILDDFGAKPLMLFDAPRVDWSLNRIAHLLAILCLR